MGETEASLNGARSPKKTIGRVQAVSSYRYLSHTVDLQAGSLQGALSLRSFLVLCVPHASFGVVVVKEVPQTQSLYLQTVLQYPAGGEEGGRDTGLKLGSFHNAGLQGRQHLLHLTTAAVLGFWPKY